jgi:regulator of replication initiation timing
MIKSEAIEAIEVFFKKIEEMGGAGKFLQMALKNTHDTLEIVSDILEENISLREENAKLRREVEKLKGATCS